MHPSLAQLAPLFFLSGAAALVAEATWLRWLRLWLGATAPAASATLVAFFAGQALGALLGARWVARARRPLRTYAALEAGAALGCLAVPVLLSAGETALAGSYDGLRDSPGLLTAIRFGLALAVTLPAALCFGATLPAMGAAALRGPGELGSRGSLLYAVNTAGGAAGVILASFWLPPLFGVNATYGVGIGLSLCACAGALWIGRREQAEPRETDEDRPRASASRSPSHRSRMSARLLALAALSGFGAFAAQVLLVQSLGQVLDQSVLAFGAVLVVVLVSLALGAAAVSVAVRGALAPAQTLLGLALGATALGLASFPALLFAATGGLDFVGSGDAWPGLPLEALGTAALTAGPLLLAASLVLPLTFALAGDEAGDAPDRGGAGARLGLLAAVNTVGALAGAVAAPFVLVPTVGLWGGFLALAFLYALPAVLVRDVSRQSRALRDLALAGGWVAVLALANPLDLPETRLEPGERLVHQESRAAGLVAVIERDGERLIRIDNHYALGGTAERVHEERQGHLPLLLHASPDRVAFVGTATGISAGAALAHPVKRVHLVELVPGVASAARRFFHDANRGVYTDPRSHTVLDDARNFLRSTGTMFDVVVADLFVPWRSGTGSLYTQEHFEAVRARLHPGGLFCQWLPLYQLQEAEFRVVAATFHAVFPEAALFRGDFFGAFPIVALVGWRGRPPAAERVSENARALARAGETDRWIADPAGVGVWALYAGPLPAPDPATPRNRDDRPRIEFQAAKTHVGGRRGVAEPLVGLRWSAVQDELRLAARAGGVPFFPDLPAEARRAAEGGAALQLASGLLVAGRADEAARALTRAATLLPPHLLAAAPADPSAADLWHDLPMELDGR